LQALALSTESSGLQGLVIAVLLPVGFFRFYVVFGIAVLATPSNDSTLWSGLVFTAGIVCLGLANGALFCWAVRRGRVMSHNVRHAQAHRQRHVRACQAHRFFGVHLTSTRLRDSGMGHLLGGVAPVRLSSRQGPSG
jgi:hypothetical protein